MIAIKIINGILILGGMGFSLGSLIIGDKDLRRANNLMLWAIWCVVMALI
jgi:hypothetical protein